MFAPIPQTDIKSRINIQFGQQITQEKTPISMDIVFDIFSQKNQNNRFVLQVFLGIQIPQNTLLLQVLSKKGDGIMLADKIMTHLKSNKKYKSQNESGKLQIKAIGKGQLCYLLINSQKFSQPFVNISKACSELNQQKKQEPNEVHEIKLQIKSTNTFQYIRKLLDNQGSMRAAFDSLSLDFTFVKTKLVQKVLQRIFIEAQLPTVLGPLKGFNNLKLSLKFSSASQLDKYQKLRIFGKVVNKIETSFLSLIKGQIKDQITFNYFNQIFSFSGKLVAQDVETFLEALFEQPNKQP